MKAGKVNIEELLGVDLVLSRQYLGFVLTVSTESIDWTLET